MTLTDAILDCFRGDDLFVEDETSHKFQAIFETDLIERLRDRRWKLPPAGFFMSDVYALGFTVKQGYEFRGKVRRSYRDGSTGRAVSDYQTLITI